MKVNFAKQIYSLPTEAYQLQLTIIAPNSTEFLSECIQTCFQVGSSKTCMKDGGCETEQGKENKLTKKHPKN